LKKSLLQAVNNLLTYVENLELSTRGKQNEQLEVLATRCSRARTSLQLLLNDLGQFNTRQPADILRFLHAKLITTPQRHNPINTGLTDLVLVLQRLLERPREQDDEARFKEENVRFRFDDWSRGSLEERQMILRGGPGLEERVRQVRTAERKRLQIGLGEAVRNIGVLEQIAEACRRLFSFSPVAPDRAGRFAVKNGHSEFEKTVSRMAKTVERARRENRISAAEMEKLVEDASQVQRDIWEEQASPLEERVSPVMDVLSWYVVPLYDTIVSSMTSAELALSKYGQVWSNEIRRFTLLQNTEEIYVLADSSKLKELLRNLFLNARHSLAETLGDSFCQYVRCLVGLMDDKSEKNDDTDIGEAKYISVRIETEGLPYTPAPSRLGPSTLDRQRKEVEEFGGELKIDLLKVENSDRTGTVAYIKLISRTDVRRSLDGVRSA
jgi:hypothetical protein